MNKSCIVHYAGDPSMDPSWDIMAKLELKNERISAPKPVGATLK